MPDSRVARGTRGLPLLAGSSFLLIGWAGLLVPSMVRSIEGSFAVSDAVLGAYYLVYSLAYAGGSILGGMLTERVGRRSVLGAAGILLGTGLAVEGVVGAWLVFTLGGAVQGLGAGAIDGGGNGLFLDLFPADRSRPLLLLHLMFSIGALVAPASIGALLGGGLAWQHVLVATAAAAIVVGLLFLVVPAPSGRRIASRAVVRDAGRAGGPAAAPADPAPGRPRRSPIALPLALLAAAIAFYVASEVGVSNWLVRYLAAVPLGVATGALSLFWAGLALGRLVSARVAHVLDPIRFTAAAAVAVTLAVTAAVAVPSVEASIALFAVAGFASGPIYPMIVAIAGERYPARAAAVAGLLGAAAVLGSVLYPPVMGLISVTLGLAPAMLGAGVLALGAAGSVAWVGRLGRPRQTAEAMAG